MDNHIIIDGRLVSERVSRVVEAIHEYSNGEIEVQYLPEGARNSEQAAFILYHNAPNGDRYAIFSVQTEAEFDERVLQKLIAGDQRRGKVGLSDYEAWEAAQQLVAKQKELDALEEMHDIVAHIIATKKNTYKVNDNLIIKEGIPFNAARHK